MAFSQMITLVVLGVASFAAAADTCNHDNCFRGFNGAAYTSDAQAYCATFTISVVTATTGLPARASACSGVARVSSVCSCAYPNTKKPITSTIVPIITPTPIKAASTLLTTTSAAVPAGPKYGPGCNADNCLRALDREGGAGGASFCASLTTALVTATASLPLYQSMCTGNPASRLSSACSCMYPGSLPSSAPPSVPAPTLTSTAPSSLPSSAYLAVTSSATSQGPEGGLLGDPNCHANNCLRAMIREGDVGATAFCASFTTANVTATTALPTYASMCTVDVTSQLSSACTCIAPAMTSGSNNGLI